MATTPVRPAADDEPLSAADRAALERALAEPAIPITAETLELLVTYADDEVRALIAAGQVAEAIGVARFNHLEATFNWNESFNRNEYYPEPLDFSW